MAKYLAGVLSVIAVGVLLIAYGLLTPRLSVNGSGAMAPMMRPMPMSEAVALSDPTYGGYAGYLPYGYAPAGVSGGYAPQSDPSVRYVPAGYPQPMGSGASSRRTMRTVAYEADAPRRVAQRRAIERTPRRDWARTALIIGGSSATGAGVGAAFGGGKGALIGAAIAGGVSTLFETARH